jgi:hypothetical protein
MALNRAHLFETACLPEPAMPVDPETAFHIHQAFADLGLHPAGAASEPPPLTREIIQRDVQAALAELDPQQLAISRRMTPAERFELVCDLNEFLRNAVIAAIHQQHPTLTEAQFRQEFLKRMGVHQHDRA